MSDEGNNQQDLIECILETIREPFLVLDRHFHVIKASKNFCHSFGLSKADVENQLLFNVGEGEWDIAKLKRLLDEVLTKGTTIEAFLVEHHFSDIGDKVFLLNARTVIAQQESDLKILLAFEDITERKKKDDEILRLAMTDPLTGLSNRNSFITGLDRAIKLARRYDHGMSLLIIDLDRFKAVNDCYGHPIGDQLLQHVAGLLTRRVREVDQVARLGGDEFAIILSGVTENETVNQIAQKYINQLKKTFLIMGCEIQIGASIGISHFPENADNTVELIRCADKALYVAKNEGRNRFKVYCDDME
ncbi:MAG: diguanylate cyclase [Methylocystaceae bacterium]|nr:diguanylate cyclase [Methylocystaceae bacterium]